MSATPELSALKFGRFQASALTVLGDVSVPRQTSFEFRNSMFDVISGPGDFSSSPGAKMENDLSIKTKNNVSIKWKTMCQ